LGFAHKDWQTVLTIEDTTGEATFLGKQRIILDPPVVENGRIVIRCFGEYETRLSDYKTDFALIFREGSASKTVSLHHYDEDLRDHYDTGLTEHKFTVEKLGMNQIEGVCFRYRPYDFVTFKNISLRPDENPGFEIELGQQ